jgi:hypothetical protein
VYYKVVYTRGRTILFMPGKTKRVFFLAVLLGLVLLVAQMHCCVDLTTGAIDSHACPICSSVGTAIGPPAPIVAMVPAINRLEVITTVTEVPLVVFRNVAPRGPPQA